PFGRVPDRLDQLDDSRDVDLVLASLEGGAEKLPNRLELAPEIRLVEVPAADERRLRPPAAPAGDAAHRRLESASAISAGTRSRTAFAPTLTALAIARAFERPWHFKKSRSNPR